MKLSSTMTFGTDRSSSSSSPHDRVRDVAAVGVIGVDQDDRVGPFATDQLEISAGVEAEVVFLAQDVDRRPGYPAGRTRSRARTWAG